jgi:pimeloyl-ACP methyl ester carboxylesterase
VDTPPVSTVEANGLTFAYLEEGPPDGPLALCLHGFPDSARTWRHLLPALGAAGYHAVAPWLRAYAPTAVPPDGQYQAGALARDANRLHAALGGTGDAVLVGHDWGALAAYGAAGHEPERWRRMVTAAVPPPAGVADGFFRYDQLRRSWYTFFFQSPLAELALPMEDFSFYDHLWADWSPGYDAAEDLAGVKEAIGTPERALAAISYYRALYDPSGHDPELASEQNAGLMPGTVPTLYLHGEDDGCFTPASIGDPLAHLAPGSELALVPAAGHFLHLERPDEVNRRILDFVGPAGG